MSLYAFLFLLNTRVKIKQKIPKGVVGIFIVLIYQVQNKEKMLKGIVGIFIVLIKLPRHVSASKCHLQEVTRSP
jgi:hypothetical protein